jgi:N12 class adenine-specific DNA methylase
MTNYLRPDLFVRAGIQNFDDWASTFGYVVTQLEPKPAGNGLRLKTRFSRFKNLPEALYSEGSLKELTKISIAAAPSVAIR